MAGPRPRYSSSDKSRYLTACRRYRKARDTFFTDPGGQREFVRASLVVQGLRGLVPKAWRTNAFIHG